MNVRFIKCMALMVFGLPAVPASLLADVKLPPVLASHMVLQRDAPVPVWGSAVPEEKVTVQFAGQTKQTAADAQGKWQIQLDPMPASAESREMTITSDRSVEPVILTDVLVGEVWLGSGQSNMAQGGDLYVKDDEVLARSIAAGPYPEIRLLPHDGKAWKESTPENLMKCSAQLFSFGLKLHQELNVPVGLIVSALSGSSSGPWVSREAYESDQACKDAVAKYAATYDYAGAIKKYEDGLERWKLAVEAAKAKGEKNLPVQPQKPVKAGECRLKFGAWYDYLIRRHIPYAIRGVLWDQGEGGTDIEGVDQYTLMGALIRGWRNDWGRDFPFVYVQKPSGGGCAWDDADAITCRAEKFAPLPALVPNDGEYRETHIRIMNYPATFMATSCDLGGGIHPLNKSGYGARAARVALGAVYGKAVEYYGPIYKSHTIEGNKVVVRFDHVGQGLAFKHGEKLQGFALAGADGKFHWAEATITGDAVELTSPKVPEPVAVRYAWAAQHRWANLFNKDGLPAIPFRTDKKKEYNND